MAKQTLDLYKLFRLVVEKGGLVEVINKKIWREIIKGLSLPASVTSAAFTLRTQYMKYLYPYECAKKKLSTPAELQAAIDGNRRDSRRTFGPFGSPGGSLSDSTHMFGSSTSPPASSSSFVVNHSPGATSRPSPGPSPTSDEVMVPPSVHGNNGVAMLHSPSLIHRTNPEYGNKRSASTSSDTARSVSSPNTSPSSSPVKKFAAATEQERERDPERGYRPQGQIPQWTHIKIQTQSKAMMTNSQSTHPDSGGSSRESRQLPLTLLDQVSDNSLLVSVELNGIVYQGVLFARQGQGQGHSEGQRQWRCETQDQCMKTIDHHSLVLWCIHRTQHSIPKLFVEECVELVCASGVRWLCAEKTQGVVHRWELHLFAPSLSGEVNVADCHSNTS